MSGFVSAARVRAVIAGAVLEADDAIPACVGTVRLHAHQRDAAMRIQTLLARDGGALLADPVGLGKTYTALAVAAREHGPVLVAIPAALREMWTGALAACDVRATLVTHEALSAGTRPTIAPNLLIVDEAHRLRSPATRRYAAVAELCRTSRVLLLSATPVHNRRADLCAELALWLGRRVWSATDAELASHVVRAAPEASAAAADALPRLDGPHRVLVNVADDCIDALLDLPPPVPAADQHAAAGLLLYGLVHQWSSSRAALVAAMQRRRARGIAMMSILESGRLPSTPEIAAWTLDGAAVQLAFPELVGPAAPESDRPDRVEIAGLRRAVETHLGAVDALLARIRRSPDPDAGRADALRSIRLAHPGERIIAFCQYAETVTALRRHLRAEPRVAALTARGGRIASGRISRAEILRQLTPPLGGAAIDVAATERIDVLITTDLLSEGLNLQRASVIVHLDLPWNPARLDQRVGRVRRLGSTHERVAVYTLAPPASAEQLLRIEQRLAAKLAIAARTVGIAGRILPSPLAMPAADARATSTAERSTVERQSALRDVVRSWHDPACAERPDAADAPLVAAAASEVHGAVAAIRERGRTLVVACLDGRVYAGVDEVLALATRANGRDAPVDAERAHRVVQQLERWLRHREGSAAIDLRSAAAERSRRTALARVASAFARAPRHRRAMLAPLVDAARAAASAPLPEGSERVLDLLARADLPDDAWLRSIAALGALHGRPVASNDRPDAPRVLALLLLERVRR